MRCRKPIRYLSNSHINNEQHYFYLNWGVSAEPCCYFCGAGESEFIPHIDAVSVGGGWLNVMGMEELGSWP